MPRDDTTLRRVDTDGLLAALHRIADDVRDALASVVDWGPSGRRDGQYSADLVADDAVRRSLDHLGVDWGVLSEESGSSNLDRELVLVVDPLDGSTNASRGVPHFATSLCLIDRSGAVAALVAHQARSTRWWATRGGGAWRDGEPIAPSTTSSWTDAVVAISGRPPDQPGWWQFRAFGASAIDLCLVADGTVDAFVDMSPSAHGVWDHGAATLILDEAGAVVVDAQGRDLLVLDHAARRTPIAAPAHLMDEARAVRSRLPL
ncbi:MAG: hypothetical protein B7C54_10730 [Acidimicrobiales bacterium mtb01]|nr:MAG: hypothetical protein B7C54_10730 [Acidimicrobiales bacterium mtb01]